MIKISSNKLIHYLYLLVSTRTTNTTTVQIMYKYKILIHKFYTTSFIYFVLAATIFLLCSINKYCFCTTKKKLWAAVLMYY